MQTSLPVVVLVEGRSDVAAVRAVMRRTGVPQADPVSVVDMGGVTNIRKHLDALTVPGRCRRLLGLCDAGEAAYFIRALVAHGVDVRSPEDMAAFGFHVCHADLEEELIRALGPDTVLEFLDTLGLSRRFGSFTSQQYWRGRELAAQLHRFIGSASGRKRWVAAELAEWAPLPSVPLPLRMLVGQVAVALTDPETPPLHRFPHADAVAAARSDTPEVPGR